MRKITTKAMVLALTLLLGSVSFVQHICVAATNENLAYVIDENIDYGGYIDDDEQIDVYHPVENGLLKATSIPSSIPSSYDLRNVSGKSYVTSVKNQEPYGTCWAFGALGSVESNLLKQGGNVTDLSEYQLAYFLYHSVSDPLCNTVGDKATITSGDSYLTLGASNVSAMFELAKWQGAVLESKAPYTSVNLSSTLNSNLAYESDAYHVQNVRIASMKDKDAVKKLIIERGGGASAIHSKNYIGNDLYYNSLTDSFYQNNASTCDHAIMVIGWNDNYSKDNFSSANRPSSNGAWLVKNSWGSSLFPYFWVSYEEKSLAGQNIYFYSAESASNYDNNYQYDGSYGSGYLEIANGDTIINKYEVVASSEEELKAISFSTRSDNVKYSIQIYKNSPSGKPTAGTKLLATPVTGTTTNAGYYTISLNEAVKLKAGDTFAVAITITDLNNDRVEMYCDMNSSNAYVEMTSATSTDQSYWIHNGSVKDMYSLYEGKGCCIRIKAFTNSIGSHTHSYKYSKTIAATCSKYGEKRYVCSCGRTRSEYIAKLEHSYTSQKVKASALKKAATSTAPAQYYYSCAKCGAVCKEKQAGYFEHGDPLYAVKVSYRTHIQSRGWLGYVSNGKISGTVKSGKRIEAMRIKLSTDANLGIAYKSYVQGAGWQKYAKNNALSGTSNKGKRIEAISIKLTGTDASRYDVYYRVYSQSYGWLGWAKNGQKAGTIGLSNRLEAIQIVVFAKGKTPKTGRIGYSFIETGKTASNTSKAGMLNYMSKVKGSSSQSYVYDGSISGVLSGKKYIEYVRMNLNTKKTGVSGNIKYRAYIAGKGWTDWITGGTVCGKTGKTVTAIQVQLTGNMSKSYDVYYRVRSKSYGWLGWTKNGNTAGAVEKTKKAEAYQVVLVKKGGSAPSYLPGKKGVKSHK